MILPTHAWLLALSCAVACPAAAEVSVLLHLFQSSRTDQFELCESASRSLTSCSELVTESDLSSSHEVYVAVAGVSILGGASFNLRFSGRTRLLSLTECPGVELLTATGDDGTLQCLFVTTEEPVPEGEGPDHIARVAVLQVQGAGTIHVEPCFGGESAAVWDGETSHLVPSNRLGSVSLAWPAPGYGPCRAAIPVEAATWGRLKAHF